MGFLDKFKSNNKKEIKEKNETVEEKPIDLNDFSRELSLEEKYALNFWNAYVRGSDEIFDILSEWEKNETILSEWKDNETTPKGPFFDLAYFMYLGPAKVDGKLNDVPESTLREACISGLKGLKENKDKYHSVLCALYTAKCI